ncbi:MAG TPA: heme exporter protein CcmD [Caulobacterales bacterium]|nr:heme exporter protein CcmD [Caulobacterales bacterium]
MQHDVWPYVIAAYCVTGVGLAGLTAFVIARLRYWAKRARDEEQR